MHPGDSPYSFAVFFFIFLSFSLFRAILPAPLLGLRAISRQKPRPAPTKTPSCPDKNPVFTIPTLDFYGGIVYNKKNA
jgi:hypothetical protein